MDKTKELELVTKLNQKINRLDLRFFYKQTSKIKALENLRDKLKNGATDTVIRREATNTINKVSSFRFPVFGRFFAMINPVSKSKRGFFGNALQTNSQILAQEVLNEVNKPQQDHDNADGDNYFSDSESESGSKIDQDEPMDNYDIMQGHKSKFSPGIL